MSIHNKEIVSSYWFSEMGSTRQIGIIKVNNGQELKYYIGTGLGENLKEDEERIMNSGGTFPKEVGELLFKLK